MLCPIFASHIRKLSILKQFSLEQGKILNILLNTSVRFSPKDTSTAASLSFETEIKFSSYQVRIKHLLRQFFSMFHCYF